MIGEPLKRNCKNQVCACDGSCRNIIPHEKFWHKRTDKEIGRIINMTDEEIMEGVTEEEIERVRQIFNRAIDKALNNNKG